MKHTKLQYLIHLFIRRVCSRLLELLLQTKTSTYTHDSSNMFWRLVLQVIATLDIAMHDPMRMIISLTLINPQCDNYYHILKTLLKIIKHCLEFLFQFFYTYIYIYTHIYIYSWRVNLDELKRVYITLVRTFYMHQSFFCNYITNIFMYFHSANRTSLPP